MIGVAKQTDDGIRPVVDLYDEDGRFITRRVGVLVGYTSTSVSIKNDEGMVDVYDENGNWKFRR